MTSPYVNHDDLKEFTQEDLKDCPPWVQSGAIDQEGDAWGYECTTKDLSYFSGGHHAMIHVKPPAISHRQRLRCGMVGRISN